MKQSPEIAIKPDQIIVELDRNVTRSIEEIPGIRDETQAVSLIVQVHDALNGL